MLYTTSNRQARPSATTSQLLPLTSGGCIPSHAQAEQRYVQRRVGHLVTSFGSTKAPAQPWRWGWSQSLKHLHILTQLSAQEHFIEFCRHKSFKTCHVLFSMTKGSEYGLDSDDSGQDWTVKFCQHRNESSVSIKVGNLFTSMDLVVLHTVQLFNNTVLVTNWILLHT